MFSIKNILELTIQKGWMENDGKICHEKIKQLRAGVAEQISDKTAFRQNNILEIKQDNCKIKKINSSGIHNNF